MRLRIACLQFEPLLGHVEANLAKINRMMSKFNREIDLLVLPELAVTGYNFTSPKDIEPLLERPNEGTSFSLAQELSRKFSCTTVVGYPEKDGKTIYNSALVVDYQGQLVKNYRKSHLYDTDKTWGCSENPVRNFPPFRLLWPEKNLETSHMVPVVTNIGICMDLNPYEFEADFNCFEFSQNCWKNDASLVIVPTAWLSTESPSIQEDLSDADKDKKAAIFKQKFGNHTLDSPETPSQSLINYWIIRFFPFLSHPMNQLPKLNHRTTVVIANRTGIEDKVLYGGSSCIFQFDPAKPESRDLTAANPSVNVLASAGWAKEEIIYLEVDL